jgi:hypothetical protein
MAGILKRGPRNAPRFYVQYDRGHTPDGERVRTTRLLKGVQNMFDARQELARVERDVQAGRDPFPEPVGRTGGGRDRGPLLQQWSEALKNRNARDDRSRITRYLVPQFGKMKVDQVTLPVVMTWIDQLSASALSPQWQRDALGLLSRFLSWCIERGLATSNPVRMVPVGKRPVARLDAERCWLEEEGKVAELMAAYSARSGRPFRLIRALVPVDPGTSERSDG